MKSRNEAAKLLLDLIRPLKPFYSKGGAWLSVGNTAAHYGEKPARMEGFARVLWGLGPLWAQDDGGLAPELQEESREWLALYQKGMKNGTNPEHEEYWGDLADYDQKMVEMASLAVAISLSPDKFWDPLTEKEKNHLYRWLDQINHKKVHPNNWRFFRILVNLAFRILGQPWSGTCDEDDWGVIEGCYTDHGWYYDGNAGQVDYYIPFAMEFYGLVYAGLSKGRDPERSTVIKKRGAEFSADFIYWFSKDGNEIPYGRSLTYRFAHSAFFSAMGFAGEEGVGYGIMKNLALKNLSLWLSRPIFDRAGVLTIGYGYPNLFMSERYNAPGSPYWAFKAFLMLALPEEHPFWTAEEEDYPYEKQKLLKQPHMLVTHDENDHVMAFTAGQHCRNHGCTAAKYEKFVYSNQFGFSVPRGTALEDGAFDNTLAVSPAGEECYRMMYGPDSFHVTEQAVYVNYRIGSLAEISSIIIPAIPWHVRVHIIKASAPVTIADGGFAIKAERCFQAVSGPESGKFKEDMVKTTPESIFADFPWGVSGIVSRTGGEPVLIQAFPNTNLLYNLTVIPMIKKNLEPGTHMVISCVLGDLSGARRETMRQCPEVTVLNGRIQIKYGPDGEKTEWITLEPVCGRNN